MSPADQAVDPTAPENNPPAPAAQDPNAAAVAPDPATPPPVEEPTNWVEAIQSEPARELAGRYESPGSMAEAQLELRQKLSEALVIPGEGASEEERADFNTKMGVPKTAGDYDFSLFDDEKAMEVDDTFRDHMGGALHAAGVSAEGAKKIMAAYNEFGMGAFNAVNEADKNFADESMAQLKRDWGDDATFECNLAAAKTFLQHPEIFGGDAEEALNIELSDGRFILDHPIFLKAFARAGLRVIEDPIRTGMPDAQVGNLEAELDRLTKDENYWQDEKLQKRVAEINRQLYGTAPAEGGVGFNRG